MTADGRPLLGAARSAGGRRRPSAEIGEEKAGYLLEWRRWRVTSPKRVPLFFLELTQPRDASVGDGRGQGTIRNDD